MNKNIFFATLILCSFAATIVPSDVALAQAGRVDTSTIPPAGSSSVSPAGTATVAPTNNANGGPETVAIDTSDADVVTQKCKTEYSQATYQVCDARPLNPGSWANKEECKAALIKACIDSENVASAEKKKATRGPYVPSQVGGLNKFGFSNVTIGIARLAKAIIGVIGSIALAMFVYGGFVWMTSRGNSEQVSKAIKTMVWSALGIVVILTSYAIVDFLFSIFG